MSGAGGPGGRDMVGVIDWVLRKNRDRMTSGMGALHGESPLESLMRMEEGDPDEEWKIRDETIQRVLGFFFAVGPDPLEVVRRVFATAKAVSPELLGDMSLEDIALLCGDGGRATVSARAKRIYNRTLEKAGMKAVKAPYQKSEEAVRTFREAQKGNQNRKNARRRKRQK